MDRASGGPPGHHPPTSAQAATNTHAMSTQRAGRLARCFAICTLGRVTIIIGPGKEDSPIKHGRTVISAAIEGTR